MIKVMCCAVNSLLESLSLCYLKFQFCDIFLLIRVFKNQTRGKLFLLPQLINQG